MFQKVLLSIIVFCAVSIVTFFLVIKVIDFNEYKPRIQKAIKDNTGYELIIKGDITLSLSPVGVRIFDIEVRNPQYKSETSFATLGSFDVALEIAPLLKKEIKIKHVSFEKLNVMIEKNKDGKSLLYLDISDKFTRPRLKTNIYIEKKYWDATKQRVKPSPNYENFNLIIENLEAKIITIKTRYTIMQQFLSAERLIEELQNISPNFDFISFFRHHLNIQDHKPRTHKNHTSVLNKLMEFSKEIPFHKIDESFFANYRKWCTEVKKNKPITYNSDVKTIKKYLNIALDKGIVLNINLKKLKINVHSQRRIYLQKEEVARLKKYFFNEFINPSHVIPLGTFLIACYTGMRISDLQEISRKELLSNIFNFSHQKSDNFQSMKANSEAIEILEHVDFLFEK